MTLDSQKTRASLLLEVYKETGLARATEYVELKEQLEQGVVVPKFHAMGMPGGLFGDDYEHPQRPPLKGDFEEFSAGKCRSAATATEEEAANATTRGLPFELKFRASNLWDVLPADGGGNGTAPSRIVELEGGANSSKPWNFDELTANFVLQLLNTKAFMLGADVEATRFPSRRGALCPRGAIDVDEPDESNTLLTRAQTRGVIKSIFDLLCDQDAAHKGAALAITGLPGIGKSWTLYYALQQLLMFEKTAVLFIAGKQQSASLILRKKEKIYVWTKGFIGQPVLDTALWDRHDIVVLYDPPVTGAVFPIHKPVKIVYTASNTPLHFRGYNGGDDLATGLVRLMRFVGPWTSTELKCAYQILNHTVRGNTNVSADEMLRRAGKVGHLPRYVIHKGGYELRLVEIENAIREHQQAPHDLHEIRSGRKILIEDTPYGVLFAFTPKSIQTTSEEADFYYDGADWDYTQIMFLIVSKFVAEKLQVNSDMYAFHGA